MHVKKLSILQKLFISVVLIYLIVPLLATLLFSLTHSWNATLLPEHYTFSYYIELWTNERFLAAFGRSVLTILVTLVFSTLFIVPVVFVVYYAYPRLKTFMELLILLPFMLPPVVASVGLLHLYAQSSLPLIGTPWILYATYFTISVPFVYRSVANSMEGIHLKELIDAGHLMGASTFGVFMRVIAPCLSKGLMIAFCLCFSILLGEFVYSNLLVGSRYETLQVYLNNMRTANAHYTSAIVISYFVITLLLTLIATRLNRRKGRPV